MLKVTHEERQFTKLYDGDDDDFRNGTTITLVLTTKAEVIRMILR